MSKCRKRFLVALLATLIVTIVTKCFIYWQRSESDKTVADPRPVKQDTVYVIGYNLPSKRCLLCEFGFASSVNHPDWLKIQTPPDFFCLITSPDPNKRVIDGGFITEKLIINLSVSESDYYKCRPYYIYKDGDPEPRPIGHRIKLCIRWVSEEKNSRARLVSNVRFVHGGQAKLIVIDDQ